MIKFLFIVLVFVLAGLCTYILNCNRDYSDYKHPKLMYVLALIDTVFVWAFVVLFIILLVNN